MGCTGYKVKNPSNPEQFDSTNGAVDPLTLLDKVSAPKIECHSNFTAERICSNRACRHQNAFYCLQSRCGSCRMHDGCTSFTIQSITQKINSKTLSLRSYIKDLLQLEDKLIEQIRQTRKTLIKGYRWEILKGRDQQILNDLFKDSQLHVQAKSEETAALYEHLNAIKDVDQSKDKVIRIGLINDFNNQIDEIAERLSLERQNFIRMYLNKKPVNKKVIEKKKENKQKHVNEEEEKHEKKKQVQKKDMKKQARVQEKKKEERQEIRVENNDEKRAELNEEQKKAIEEKKMIKQISKSFNSKIVAKNFEVEQFIIKALNIPKKIQLIFRASEHAFSAKEFHLKCDSASHTFTLIRTEFGKTIGGYSPCKWGVPNPPAFVEDPEKKSFLLSIDLKEKMTLNEAQRAIRCDNNWGPIFGGGQGSDIAISDKCFSNQDSYMGFPWSYNTDNKYKRRPETYTAFCGATKGYWFKVLEYEVFKVEW